MSSYSLQIRKNPHKSRENIDLCSSGSIHCVNTVFSPNLLVWKYCGKAQFLHQEIRLNCDILSSDRNSVFAVIAQKQMSGGVLKKAVL